jgi:hypothetical protein
MIVPKPLRVAGIIICGVMLAAPAIACFRATPPGSMKVMDFVHVLFPLWFILLVQICIDEGRARERQRSSTQQQQPK